MNSMTYKGFSARVDYDAEDEILVGRIIGISDVIGFHADNAADLKAAFHDAVDDYVETCAKAGKEPEKAYSGKLMLRIEPKLHRSLAVAAELAGISLNQLSERALEQVVEHHATSPDQERPIGPQKMVVTSTEKDASNCMFALVDGKLVSLTKLNQAIEATEGGYLVRANFNKKTDKVFTGCKTGSWSWKV